EEESLLDTVNDLIEQAVERPVEFGLHKAVADDMVDGPAFRERVARGTMVLSSRLFPLSRLLYLEEGIEEIYVCRWDKWVVQGSGSKAQLSAEGNPFANDEEWLSFFKEKVITLSGSTGQKMLSQGRPTAEVNIGGIMRLALLQAPAISGPTNLIATIRIQGTARVRTLEDYVQQAVMPQGVSEFLQACIRGKADVCLAASTGHDGSMVTLHADDAEEAIRRAAEYVMMAPDFMGASNSEGMAARRVHQAFDVAVHLQESKGRRRMTGVIAIGDQP